MTARPSPILRAARLAFDALCYGLIVGGFVCGVYLIGAQQ